MVKKLTIFLSIFFALTVCSNVNEDITPTPQPTSGSNPEPEVVDVKIEKVVRIIVLADPYKKDHWMANKAHGLKRDYTAQDIIEMIEDLKPDCLERFVTGKQDPNALVPVRDGYPPMTVLEFLNACILAGSDKCHIIPKLNFQWIDWGDEKLFWESAQNLYDLKLVRPIRNINLDVWTTYCDKIHTTPEERAVLFKRLRDIGYIEIGVNYTGNIKTNDPQIDYADFCIKKETWSVNSFAVETLNSYSNIKRKYLYIDYPEPMHTFMKLSPDKQADVYCNEIYPKQLTMGYTYVYPIIQDDWDAHEHYTLYSGPYQGKSMYDITKELLSK